MLFEQRIGAVEAVAQATRERIAKQAEASEAEQREAAAWAEALRRGWSEDELKGMGLVAPGRKAAGRPRSRRRAASAAPKPPASDSANANGAEQDAGQPAAALGG